MHRPSSRAHTIEKTFYKVAFFYLSRFQDREHSYITSKFFFANFALPTYSHLFNKRGGWNKRGGGAKVAKLLNVQVGINVEGGIFWKKLVHKSNKRGVEGGKI